MQVLEKGEMRLSKTQQCILRDCQRDGFSLLGPRAKSYVEKMRSLGIVVFRQRKGGWLRVTLKKQ